MLCKYCLEDDGEVLLHGGVAIDPNAPIARAYVCAECAERGQDWFHDSDMEARG